MALLPHLSKERESMAIICVKVSPSLCGTWGTVWVFREDGKTWEISADPPFVCDNRNTILDSFVGMVDDHIYKLSRDFHKSSVPDVQKATHAFVQFGQSLLIRTDGIRSVECFLDEIHPEKMTLIVRSSIPHVGALAKESKDTLIESTGWLDRLFDEFGRKLAVFAHPRVQIRT